MFLSKIIRKFEEEKKKTHEKVCNVVIFIVVILASSYIGNYYFTFIVKVKGLNDFFALRPKRMNFEWDSNSIFFEPSNLCSKL